MPSQRLTALCHAIAAQLSAFLLSSMPMHPKQNLAAANRYGVPLFLRKSHQRFSLPFLRISSLRHSIARLINASPLLFNAMLCRCQASPCLAFALPVCASQCRCVAVGCDTLPLHSSSPHSPAFASPRIVSHRHALATQCGALPSQFHALLLRRGAVPYEPCRFSANQGHQCHAAAVSSGFGK